MFSIGSAPGDRKKRAGYWPRTLKAVASNQGLMVAWYFSKSARRP
jgi:hypothetical protein